MDRLARPNDTDTRLEAARALIALHDNSDSDQDHEYECDRYYYQQQQHQQQQQRHNHCPTTLYPDHHHTYHSLPSPSRGCRSNSNVNLEYRERSTFAPVYSHHSSSGPLPPPPALSQTVAEPPSSPVHFPIHPLRCDTSGSSRSTLPLVRMSPVLPSPARSPTPPSPSFPRQQQQQYQHRHSQQHQQHPLSTRYHQLRPIAPASPSVSLLTSPHHTSLANISPTIASHSYAQPSPYDADNVYNYTDAATTVMAASPKCLQPVHSAPYSRPSSSPSSRRHRHSTSPLPPARHISTSTTSPSRSIRPSMVRIAPAPTNHTSADIYTYRVPPKVAKPVRSTAFAGYRIPPTAASIASTLQRRERERMARQAAGIERMRQFLADRSTTAR